jgi:D-amino-acid dehydrogenase
MSTVDPRDVGSSKWERGVSLDRLRQPIGRRRWQARAVECADVVVVGGGLVGAALAYELTGAGARTVLIDRHDPGRATDAGAGILSAETLTVTDEAWFALALAAADHYRRLVPELDAAGAGDTGYAACGALRIAFREGDDDLYRTGTALALARCGDVVAEISPDDARTRFPPLGEVRAALHNPRAARVDGRLLTGALLRAAGQRGLSLRSEAVTGLVLAGDEVTAVQTGTGRVGCGAVAIAGGAWTPAIARELRASLPVRPVRGQIVHLRLDGADTGRWPILQPVLSHYIVPWPAGRLAVGATVEPDAGFDARPTAAGMRQLLSEMLHLAPGLAGATFVEARAGLRPVSLDDAPILGRVPGSVNAYAATGHGANGLLLGPFSGRLVSDLILGRSPAFDLMPFRPARFVAP